MRWGRQLCRCVDVDKMPWQGADHILLVSWQSYLCRHGCNDKREEGNAKPAQLRCAISGVLHDWKGWAARSLDACRCRKVNTGMLCQNVYYLGVQPLEPGTRKQAADQGPQC